MTQLDNKTEKEQPQVQEEVVRRYDPQQAYFDRMNSTQRANLGRRQQHQFADSIGGCSANYRW